MEKVTEFWGEYRFLSNFYEAPFEWSGVLWMTSEHAYQAAKTQVESERLRIIEAPTPQAAKRLGKSVTMRDDWNEVRVGIMYEIVSEKFYQNPGLKQKLLATGTAVIEEGNTWGDKILGICPPGSGIGRNELGKILMKLRNEIRFSE